MLLQISNETKKNNEKKTKQHNAFIMWKETQPNEIYGINKA